MKQYTSKEAAEYLGFKDASRIRQLILAGKIAAEKFGRDWTITQRELDRYKKAHCPKSKDS